MLQEDLFVLLVTWAADPVGLQLYLPHFLKNLLDSAVYCRLMGHCSITGKHACMHACIMNAGLKVPHSRLFQAMLLCREADDCEKAH